MASLSGDGADDSSACQQILVVLRSSNSVKLMLLSTYGMAFRSYRHSGVGVHELWSFIIYTDACGTTTSRDRSQQQVTFWNGVFSPACTEKRSWPR